MARTTTSIHSGHDEPSLSATQHSAALWATIDRLTILMGLFMLIFGTAVAGELSTIAVLVSRSLAVTLIGVGAVWLGIGVYGCYHERRPGTKSWRWYALLHTLLLTTVLVVGIQATRHKAKAETMLSTAWTREYSLHPAQLEWMERNLYCCGYSTLSDRAVPETCAMNYQASQPCQAQVYAVWMEALSAVQVIALGSVVLILLGLPAAACMTRKRRTPTQERLLPASPTDTATVDARTPILTADSMASYAATTHSL